MDKCRKCSQYFTMLLTGSLCGNCHVEVWGVDFGKPSQKYSEKVLDDKQRVKDMRKELSE